ncbi:MAG: type I methionyl aminopeptidase [Spirochaetia bacterium]
MLKTRRDLKRLTFSGSCVARTLSRIASEVKPGVPSSYLEEVCRSFLAKELSGFRVEHSRMFPRYLAVSINETAVHGIPGDTLLRGGDLVTLDLALKIDGWYGDSALTVPVGTLSPEKMRIIEAAKEATDAGIRAIRPGGRLGDIGAAVGKVLAERGLRVIENLAGHGVGMELHEPPTVLHSGEAGVGDPIVPGMVFTVEPVVTPGEPIVVAGEDGYGLVTRDGAPTASFEHTLAVTSEGVVCLTSADL